MAHNTGTKASAVIRSAASLWHALIEQGGLSTGMNASDYDDAFHNELRINLFGETATGDLSSLLEAGTISPESFLIEFFRSAEPYAQMTADILSMFELAAASLSTHNLSIAIDVDAVGSHLRFDLEHFRQDVEVVKRAVGSTGERQWTTEAVSRLWDVIVSSKLSEFFGPQSKWPIPSSSSLCDWLARMESRDHRFPTPPPMPLTGIPEFDRLAREFRTDLAGFQTAGRRWFGKYSNIRSGFSDSTRADQTIAGWHFKTVTSLAHDFFPRRLVHMLGLLGEQLSQSPDDPDVRKLLDELIAFHAPIATAPTSLAELQAEFDSLISLPLWQRRHELYAVWIASVIVLSLRDFGVTFHTQNGVLEFPFRATRIATFGPRFCPQLDLHSELRTPAHDLVGRKESIQPDYRLRRVAPKPPYADAPDVVVVECKQYKRSSKRNFSAALTDYAQGTPNAQVALVNYGPVSSSVQASLDKTIASRCRAFGNVMYGSSEYFAVREYLLEHVSEVLCMQPLQKWRWERIAVTLRWFGEYDLDLHVTTPTEACGYTSTRIFEASLHGDDRGLSNSLHSELITISPFRSERFDVFVDLYDGGQTIDQTQACLIIECTFPSGETEQFNLKLSQPMGCIHAVALLKGYLVPFMGTGRAVGFKAGKGWSPADPIELL